MIACGGRTAGTSEPVILELGRALEREYGVKECLESLGYGNANNQMNPNFQVPDVQVGSQQQYQNRQQSYNPGGYQRNSGNQGYQHGGYQQRNYQHNQQSKPAAGGDPQLAAILEYLKRLEQDKEIQIKTNESFERQLGQLAEKIAEVVGRAPGQLPSDTKLNPQHQGASSSVDLGKDGKSDSDSEAVFIKQPKKVTFSETSKSIPNTTVTQGVGVENNTIPYPAALLEPSKKNVTKRVPQQDKLAPLISVQIGELKINKVLLDLGASVSIIPGSLYDQYDFGPLQKADTTVVLADLTLKLPRGILTDVIMKVEDFYYPVDFLVLDYVAPTNDRHLNVILGRPFLKTAQCVINCITGTVDMAFGNRRLRLNIFASAIPIPINGECFMADVVEGCHPHENEGETLEPCIVCDRKQEEYELEMQEAEAQVEVYALRERVPNWSLQVESLPKHIDTQLKPSLESPPKLYLKDLLKHLKYAFVGDNNTLPVIIAAGLTEEQEQALMKVLIAHREAIGWTIADLKGISPAIVMHKIVTEEGAKPARDAQRRLNPNMREVVKKEVLKWLDAGIIYPISDSSWVSPTQTVPKKAGIQVIKGESGEEIATRPVNGWRICIDYRKLNAATSKDHFPLPFIYQIIEKLAVQKFYGFLDGYSGYNKIAIHPEDQQKTTFTCPYGTFTFRRMPFGLGNAPATFQRCMMSIFSDMIGESMKVFMDDFSIFGITFETCLNQLTKVLKRCVETNMVLSWEKSHFMVQEGVVLGHVISSKGIEVDHAKIRVISTLPPPNSVKGVRSFLGHAGFYRSQVPHGKEGCQAQVDPLDLDGSESEGEINETFPDEQLLSVSTTPWFANIVNYLAKDAILEHWSKKKRHQFIAQARQYIWDEPDLFKVGADQLVRRCIPESEIQCVLGLVHASACGGHFSGQKTGMERKLQLNEPEELRDAAYECASAYKDRMKKVHDAKLKKMTFEVGQKVWLYNSRLKLFPGKLNSKWMGPYLITRVGNYGDIKIEDFDDHLRQVVNGHRLKPYLEASDINFIEESWIVLKNP
ncbi:hypothetical protein L1987_87570 [Smallanthus sonchifolius]|nr:hypothetical protein L1987_87570 [Smallanthus sonchifolius]